MNHLSTISHLKYKRTPRVFRRTFPRIKRIHRVKNHTQKHHSRGGELNRTRANQHHTNTLHTSRNPSTNERTHTHHTIKKTSDADYK